MERAGNLYRDFSGHEPEEVLTVKEKHADTGLIIGECAGIMYDTVRDGKEEKYIHRFKKKARPLLAASHDGKKLMLVGGDFRFTERGITDNG